VNALGFDTSSAATSACVLRSDGQAFELRPGPAALFEPPAHASELLPRVADVLGKAGLDGAPPGSWACGRSRRWRHWRPGSTRRWRCR